MHVDVTIAGADAQGRNFLTWSPARANARVIDAQPGTVVYVVLRNAGPGGQVVFGIPGDPQPFRDAIALNLRADGTPVPFAVAGRFGSPSADPDDATIQVLDSNNAPLGSKALSVRVRKNAQRLTPRERDRFLSALGALNDRGLGAYSDFRSIHVVATSNEAHGNRGFLPWHRAYLLDLERELQRLDPSVALPYWRFDEPAPNLFTREFIGVSNQFDRVQFAPGHALEFWATDNAPGIVRGPRFFTNQAPSSLRSERDTLLISPGRLYGEFAQIEFNPHGFAHASFRGHVSDIGAAVKDPLFFLLHANVDRLWAKWQWLNRRFDAGVNGSYAPANPPRIGHNLNDTMWPWNGIVAPPRPSSAPGGPFPSSTAVEAPGGTPTVQSMLDYGGVLAAANALGFAYDDVPFEV